MASTIARALIEGATWESIQAQPYDGTRYPCGCHPHPKEPHLWFHLCDYHDGFDSGVDQGCHKLQTENERLWAALAAERALADQMARALAAVKADRPTAHTHEVWTAVCDALDDYGKARREQ